MKRNCKILSFIAIFFAIILSFQCNAQLIYQNRLALWPSLSVQKKIGDNWKVKLEHSTRMKFMPFMIDETYFQIGAEYQIRHNISAEINYRFSEAWSPEEHFMPAHRISLEADFSFDIKRWSFALHPAVQTVFSRANIMENLNPQWCFRPKVQVSYNIRKSKFEPLGSIELFIGRKPQYSFSAYKYRISLGAVYKITKCTHVELYLRQQGGFITNDNPSSYSILGMDWSWRF